MDQVLGEIEAPTSIRKKVFSEQVKILHHNLPTSLPGNFMCAVIIFIFCYTNQTNTILAWFTAVIIVSTIRLLGLYFYRHYPNHDYLHLLILTGGMTLSAILWAILAFTMMPKNPLGQMLTIVILAGVTAGGIQTLSANLKGSLLYLNIIILPLCAWLFLQNNFSYHLLSFAVITFYTFMLTTAVRGYKLITSSLYLKYENLALIEKLSVSNARLVNAYQLLEKHDQKIILINKMNEMLQACQKIQQAYAAIQSIGKELFSDYNGALYMRNSLNHLEIVAEWGDEKNHARSFDSTNCWALRKGHAYEINSGEDKLICQHFDCEPNTSICLPLDNQIQNMGVLILYSSLRQALTHEQIQFAHTFTEVIQLAIANINLRENLYQQSIHDPLTGLYNRRFLDETLSRELQRSLREKNHLCVAMIDLDHFKLFNDKHGHEAGDEVLKYVSSLLQDSFRGHDICCRFGGEEFLIVIVDSDISSAKTRLDDLRKAIKNGKVYFQDKLLPPMTISIGLAQAPEHGITANTIIHTADIALYSAKEKGRDRIECSQVRQVQPSETYEI